MMAATARLCALALAASCWLPASTLGQTGNQPPGQITPPAAAGESTPSGKAAGQTASEPGEKRSGKTTNRAGPVADEPAALADPAPATAQNPQPATPDAPAPLAAPAAPAGPATPAIGETRPSSIPVFANPAMQGIGKSAPEQPPGMLGRPATTAAAIRETPAPPRQPDWRDSAAPPDAAFGAYQRGLYVSALQEALKAAKADATNAAAMTLIGEIYRDGLGIRQNYQEAFRWYRLADERGDPQAAFAIARAFVEGLGVPQDFKQAKIYFERAAAKEHPGALYNLGIMAIDGEIQDYKKAAEFFRRAMDLGNLDAAYSLAFLYRSGQGVEKDEAEATRLLRVAADQHHLPAMIDFAISLFNGRGIEADEAGASVYFIRAAWRNAPVAQNRLARMYVAGRGVRIDLVEAMKWHVLARTNGLKDEWLDSKMTQLTTGQREIVEEAVRKFAVK